MGECPPWCSAAGPHLPSQEQFLALLAREQHLAAEAAASLQHVTAHADQLEAELQSAKWLLREQELGSSELCDKYQFEAAQAQEQLARTQRQLQKSEEQLAVCKRQLQEVQQGAELVQQQLQLTQVPMLVAALRVMAEGAHVVYTSATHLQCNSAIAILLHLGMQISGTALQQNPCCDGVIAAGDAAQMPAFERDLLKERVAYVQQQLVSQSWNDPSPTPGHFFQPALLIALLAQAH